MLNGSAFVLQPGSPYPLTILLPHFPIFMLWTCLPVPLAQIPPICPCLFHRLSFSSCLCVLSNTSCILCLCSGPGLHHPLPPWVSISSLQHHPLHIPHTAFQTLQRVSCLPKCMPALSWAFKAHSLPARVHTCPQV